ncbi:MAG TPA: phytanoyl-CoA dioxygenase family protein [Acidimicrobiales bacterium]|nr:phytanoyl-CoA dioxygenase family protein [Acidimicrobiales bacterium]
MGPPTPATEVGRYRRDGFLVVEGLLSDDELASLRAESVRVCRNELAATDGHGDREGEREGGRPDAYVLQQFLCIHFPHKVSAVFFDLLSHPSVVGRLTGIIGPDVKAMQSMLFIKSEGKPGQAWHQDEYFIPTRDRSLTGVWIALDDATVQNGCLWVLPGSHQAGVIYPERQIDDTRFDCTTEAYQFPYRDDDAVPVEVRAGSAVILDGYLLHRSLPNLLSGSLRRAIVHHYMSASSLLPWRPPREGEHMAMVDDRDIVMVAGNDPYAYKGLEERHQTYLRPDREGGCER